jgi:hypothetical protein
MALRIYLSTNRAGYNGDALDYLELNNTLSRAVPWNGTIANFSTSTTTPFRLAMNDVTGERYAPRAPETTLSVSGGAFGPYQPLAIQRSTVTETIPLQIVGQTRALAQEAASILHRVLQSATVDGPALLFIEPESGDGTVVWRVFRGAVQETAQTFNEEASQKTYRVQLLIERDAVGVNGTIEQLFNSTTFTNGIGQAFPATLNGEYATVGQPLSLILDGTWLSSAALKTLLIGIAKSEAVATGSSSAVTSSTSGVLISGATASLTVAEIGPALFRALVTVTGPSANLQIRAELRYGNSTGQILYQSPWLSTGSVGTQLVDCGGVAIDLPTRGALFAGKTMACLVYARSSNGSATTGNVTRTVILNLATWSKLITVQSTGTADTVELESFAQYNTGSGVFTPIPPIAYVSNGGVLRQRVPIRGTPPVALAGYRLFLAGYDGSNYDTTDTIIVTARHLPMYATARSVL